MRCARGAGNIAMMVDSVKGAQVQLPQVSGAFDAQKRSLVKEEDRDRMDTLKTILMGHMGSGPLTAGHLDRISNLATGASPSVAKAIHAVVGELGNLAGLTDSMSSHRIRQGAASVRDVGTTGAKDFAFLTQSLVQQGRGGLAVGQKGLRRQGEPSKLHQLSGALNNASDEISEAKAKGGPISISASVYDALGDQLNDSVLTLGMGLYRNKEFGALLSKFASKPTKDGMLALLSGTGSALCETMGLKMVNKEAVEVASTLLPSFATKMLSGVGKSMAKEGGKEAMEVAAKKVAQTVVKEGAEVAAKQGVKKGLMGALSAIPIANVIPMLFTSGELLGEFASKGGPKTASLAKGFSVLALQLGALFVPPLGLVATGVDITGSVAIAATEAKKAGATQEEANAAARGALKHHDLKESEMEEAVASGGDLSSHALDMMAKFLGDLNPARAEKAEALATKLKSLKDAPDEETAAQHHHEIGFFLVDEIVPELATQVGLLKDRSEANGPALEAIKAGLDQVSMATHFLRKGEKRSDKSEVNLEGLLKGIIQITVGAKELGANAEKQAE